MKKILLLAFVFTLPAFTQTNQLGPTNISQINSTLYVGAVPGTYTSIQTAVTSACAASANRTVDVPVSYTGTEPVTSITGGCTATNVIDRRALPTVCYTWIGSAYAATACSAGSISSIAGLLEADNTTTSLSGAGTSASPYVVSAVGQMQLNPSGSQTVNTPGGSSVYFTQTTDGNLNAIINKRGNCYGYGYSNGNNDTSAGTGWGGCYGDNDTLVKASQGISQQYVSNFFCLATGDCAQKRNIFKCYGNTSAASDEGCESDFHYVNQVGYLQATLIQPFMGYTSPINFDSAPAGISFIYYTDGGHSNSTQGFATAGNLASFSMPLAQAPSTAYTAYLFVATPAGTYGPSSAPFTISNITPLSVPTTAGLITFTPADFGTIHVPQGSYVGLYVPAGHGDVYDNFTGNVALQSTAYQPCVSGLVAAGVVTFTTNSSGCGNGQLYAALTAPTQGSTVISTGSISPHGDWDEQTPLLFPAGGILTDYGASSRLGLGTATLNGMGTTLGAHSYTISAGTIPTSTAIGTIIGTSCTNNGSGTSTTPVSTTCNVTVSSGAFSTSHSMCMAGTFAEQVPVTNVAAVSSGIVALTFSTIHAYNSPSISAVVAQGGPCSDTTGELAIVQYSAITTWPIAYPLIAFDGTNLIYANCAYSNCLGGGNVLQASSASPLVVGLIPMAWITGTNGGNSGQATLGFNTVPFQAGDTLVGAPTANYHVWGNTWIYSQSTPTDNGSYGFYQVDNGPVPLTDEIKIQNGATSAPYTFIDTSGLLNNWALIENRPLTGGALIHVYGNSLDGTHPYTILQDDADGTGGSGLTISFDDQNSDAAFGVSFTAPVIAPLLEQKISGSYYKVCLAGYTVSGCAIPGSSYDPTNVAITGGSAVFTSGSTPLSVNTGGLNRFTVDSGGNVNIPYGSLATGGNIYSAGGIATAGDFFITNNTGSYKLFNGSVSLGPASDGNVSLTSIGVASSKFYIQANLGGIGQNRAFSFDYVNGNLSLAGGTSTVGAIAPKYYTVSTLPTSNVPTNSFVIVTDATSSGVCVGGGSITTIAMYTGTVWTCLGVGPPTGTAGGDLSGSYPNPTVSGSHIVSGTIDGVTAGATTPLPSITTNLMHITTPSITGGQIAQATCPGLATSGDSCAMGVGRAISSGNSVFLAWWNSNFGSIETFGSASPITLRGTNVVLSGPTSIDAGGLGDTLGHTCTTGLELCDAAENFKVDTSGNTTATSYTGPVTAPSGSCTQVGAWVFSQDGHATFCASGTWVTKI